MKRWLTVAMVVLGAFAVLGTLGALWWWALFGMSPNVGAAWEGTLFFSGGLAFIACIVRADEG